MVWTQDKKKYDPPQPLTYGKRTPSSSRMPDFTSEEHGGKSLGDGTEHAINNYYYSELK